MSKYEAITLCDKFQVLSVSSSRGRFLLFGSEFIKIPTCCKKMDAGFVFRVQKSIKENILEIKTNKSWNLSRSVIKSFSTGTLQK